LDFLKIIFKGELDGEILGGRLRWGGVGEILNQIKLT